MRMTPMAQRSRKAHHRLVLAVLLIGMATLGARAGALHWVGDTLALVTDYLFWAALLLFLICLRHRAWRPALASALVLLLSAAQLLGHPRVVPVPAAEAPQLRLLVYNLYYRNDDLPTVLELVRHYDPDVVFLMEYSDAIQQQIETSFAAYPHRLIRTSRFTMGLALFSRLPIEAVQIHRTDETRIPVFEAQLQLGADSFSFVGGHPWPPQPRWGDLHRRQMQAIGGVAAGAPPPRIVAGDFNAAPWSYSLRQLAEQADVRLVRRHLDVSKTWQPLPGIGLPLDHVLVSEEWRVLSRQYGPAGGSDHRPLIFDLSLASPSSASGNPE
jgi:endonuclease/exonuclease/phosphatase (EEP) superfamily protein YafD